MLSKSLSLFKKSHFFSKIESAKLVTNMEVSL